MALQPIGRLRLYILLLYAQPSWSESHLTGLNLLIHNKLSTMHILTGDANDDSDAVHGLVDTYVVQLNDAMHDAVTEAGCKQKHCNKPKTYLCPELSHLRDRKRFWWRLWNDNDRPRAGYMTYRYIKKVFRRRIRQCVDRWGWIN